MKKVLYMRQSHDMGIALWPRASLRPNQTAGPAHSAVQPPSMQLVTVDSHPALVMT
jgi:hypothetical protein